MRPGTEKPGLGFIYPYLPWTTHRVLAPGAGHEAIVQAEPGGAAPARSEGSDEGAGLGSARVPVALVGADPELLLLLRGVLALHRAKIVLEARTAQDLREVPAGGEPLLLLDAGDGEGPWQEELTRALEDRPTLRALVLLPSDADARRSEALRLGARATLGRPFTIRELFRAIDEAAGEPAGSSGIAEPFAPP